MTTTIALLRGINVSGQKPVPMERLRACLEADGLREVRTYVQSGNVVYKGGEGGAAAEEKRIARVIAATFGFDVPVLARTAEELRRVAAANPFLSEPGVDPAHLHVTFLAGPPKEGGLTKLGAIAAGDDRFREGERALYIHCPNGYGRTKLSNTAIERCLGVGATTRNWKTVGALLTMAGS